MEEEAGVVPGSSSSVSGMSSTSPLGTLCTDVELSAAAASVLKDCLKESRAPSLTLLSLSSRFTLLDDEEVFLLSSPAPAVRLARASAAAIAAESSDWSMEVEGGHSGPPPSPRVFMVPGRSDECASTVPLVCVSVWSGFAEEGSPWPTVIAALSVVSLRSTSLLVELCEVDGFSFDVSVTLVDLQGAGPLSSCSGGAHRFLGAGSSDCLHPTDSLMFAGCIFN